MYYHALSIHISPIELQEYLIGHDLWCEFADLQLGMEHEVDVVVVQWAGGVCHLPCSSIVEINYLSNTNQNYKMVHVSSRVHDLIFRALRPYLYV